MLLPGRKEGKVSLLVGDRGKPQKSGERCCSGGSRSPLPQPGMRVLLWKREGCWGDRPCTGPAACHTDPGDPLRAAGHLHGIGKGNF